MKIIRFKIQLKHIHEQQIEHISKEMIKNIEIRSLLLIIMCHKPMDLFLFIIANSRIALDDLDTPCIHPG